MRLAGWLISALSAGFLGYVWGRPAVALMVGSSNVKAHLKLPAGIRPIWIDVPSRDGLAALFHAAEYGAKTGASPEALLGLSSYGTEELSILWDQGTLEERAKNYWLSIRVGTPPLALLYSRHLPNDDSRYPKMFRLADGSLRINCSDLNTFFSDLNKFFKTTESDPGINVYMPEPRTGTRLALEEECGFDTNAWPNHPYGDWLRYPRQNIADLESPFVDLVSVPMVMDEIPGCSDLDFRHIEVATVCKDRKTQGVDCGSLENLARADHVIVVKVKHEGGVYTIANPMECEIAKSLILKRTGSAAEADVQKPWLDNSCTIHGEPFPPPPINQLADKKHPPHVFEIEGRDENLPKYWTCPKH